MEHLGWLILIVGAFLFGFAAGHFGGGDDA